MADWSIGSEYIRNSDGFVFRIIETGGNSSIKLENVANGRGHWVSGGGLKKKYKFVVPRKVEEVD